MTQDQPPVIPPVSGILYTGPHAGNIIAAEYISGTYTDAAGVSSQVSGTISDLQVNTVIRVTFTIGAAVETFDIPVHFDKFRALALAESTKTNMAPTSPIPFVLGEPLGDQNLPGTPL